MIPEKRKKPGVCYAFASNGLELPVIDITHPAFHQALSEEQLFAGAQRYAQAQEAQGAVARWMQRHLLPFFLKRSIIGRGLLKSRGGYLDGLSTYLLKLGPDNLGEGYATPMDRKLAAGLNGAGLSLGQRLQDMAEALAQGLRPLLTADAGRPLHLVNIAGGPSMDSLNALILLYKEKPAAFAARPVTLHILDLEAEGAGFAEAALAALQAEGGPLQGLSATLLYRPYDWTDTAPLQELLRSLPGDALLAASSEGGLFDYGQDEAVSANLRVLGDLSPADTVLAASLSRPEDAAGLFKGANSAQLVLRSLDDLAALGRPCGWSVASSTLRPLNAIARLTKA
jgi:hypothetical protein